MRRFTGHGPRRVAAALVVLALLCVATPIARAWDYVYGDPGPENYSEYEVAALGPDGSTYVIGYFIGEFRGLTSPDAIRYFVEKISTSGAIAWTVPIDVLPTIDPGFQRFPSWIFVDGSGVVYSKTGSTLLTLSDAGEVRARNADLGFYADIDIWPAGGVITTNERVVTAMTPDLDTAWTRDMSDLIDSADMSVKVATDDSVWILGEKKRTTFLGRDALAMVHLDADGALLATIKHYGLQPKRPTSYQSAVIGASSNFLWVWTSGALDGTSAERPHAFSAVDGRLLGEVALDVQSGETPYVGGGWCRRGVLLDGLPPLPVIAAMNGSRILTIEHCNGLDPATGDSLATSYYVVERTFEDPLATDAEVIKVRRLDPSLVPVDTNYLPSNVPAIAANEYGEWAIVGQTPGTPLFASSAMTPGTLLPQAHPVEVTSTNPRAVAAKDPLGSLYFGRRAAGSTLEVKITGRRGVPTGSKAAALTVTALNPSTAGSIVVFPCGTRPPTASTLNFAAGETTSNTALARLSGDGKVCIRSTAATHLLVDVNGEAGPASDITTFRPTRFLDTRSAGATFDGNAARAGTRPAGSITRVKIAGRGTVPADASTVVVNLTAVKAAANGRVTVYNCDRPIPTAPSLTVGTGRTTAAMAILKPATDGTVCIRTTVATDLILDTNGYARAASTLAAVRAIPLLDTRSGTSTVDGISAAIGRRNAGSTTVLSVAGRASIPSVLEMAALTVTVIGPSASGLLRVFPCGNTTSATSMSYTAGRTITLTVLSALDASGRICINTTQATDLSIAMTARATPGTSLDMQVPTRFANTTR